LFTIETDNSRRLSFAIFVSTSTVAAFVVQPSTHVSTKLNAEQSSSSRREFFTNAAAVVAAMSSFAAPALADVDYAGVGLLGGSSVVDINNANVRVYLKMPGLYPTIAGKIASNGPYAAVSDIYNIPGLSSKEKDLLKKYESRFTAQKPSADYVIDRINNGL
jgi:photosystem II PsbU protein